MCLVYKLAREMYLLGCFILFDDKTPKSLEDLELSRANINVVVLDCINLSLLYFYYYIRNVLLPFFLAASPI